MFFEVNCKAEYLERALDYTDFMLKHFWDANSGSLFLTSDDNEQLITRTKNFYDLAIPSGNSVAAYDFLRLFKITQNQDYFQKTEEIIKAASRPALNNPFGFGHLLITMSMYLNNNPTEVIIIQRPREKSSSYQMSSWLNNKFLPDGINIVVRDIAELERLQKYPLFSGRNMPSATKNKPEVAFVCRKFACSLPLDSIEELQKIIGPK